VQAALVVTGQYSSGYILPFYGTRTVASVYSDVQTLTIPNPPVSALFAISLIAVGAAITVLSIYVIRRQRKWIPVR
jgi:Flp pilus assembly protein protease CpaA